MDSLQWVDQTYYAKHKSEDPTTLRATYYTELRMYQAHGETSKRRPPMDAALAFLVRFGRRAGISLAIYALSYLPVVGRFVLPAASFYTFNNAVGPVPATIIFGSGIFLPRKYLVVFLQSYFTSRRLMRELVRSVLLSPASTNATCSWNRTSLASSSPRSRSVTGSATAKGCSLALLSASTYS